MPDAPSTNHSSIPHTVPFDWSSLHPGPGKLAAAIQSAGAQVNLGARGLGIALLGLPDDTGVGLNRGRLGARHGPRAFREALARYGCSSQADSGIDLSRVLAIYDAGDVQPAGDEIHRTHQRITEAVGAILSLGLLPVCLGGGHDLTYAAVRAVYEYYAARGEILGGLNVDPHLDVRETVGSGMSFRRILEDSRGVVDPKYFAEVGTGQFTNSREHLDYLRGRGSAIVVFDGDEARLLEQFEHCMLALLSRVPNLFASFDLDVLDASIAPGVSALNPMGLHTASAARICRIIGRQPHLRYFDLMELAPEHDEQGRTARVAAHLFVSFVAGLAERIQTG